MGKDIFYLLVAAGVLLLVGGVGFFIIQQRSSESEVQQPVQVLPPLPQDQGLGSELLENPGTLVPDTNPFQDVDTNPLQGTNPFEGGSKNPFGE